MITSPTSRKQLLTGLLSPRSLMRFEGSFREMARRGSDHGRRRASLPDLWGRNAKNESGGLGVRRTIESSDSIERNLTEQHQGVESARDCVQSPRPLDLGRQTVTRREAAGRRVRQAPSPGWLWTMEQNTDHLHAPAW